MLLDAFFLKPQGVIGIDIGTASIKLIEIEESKGGYRLKNFGIGHLPKDSIVNGSILNHDGVVSVLQQLISNLKVKCKNAVVSISGHPVIIKKITMPLATNEELADSIKYEAEQYIPFALEEVNIDFRILSVDEEKTEQMNVMLVAAKKVMINEYTKVLTAAGLRPIILDIDVFALENAFELNYNNEEKRTIALVDIGASTTNINIIRDRVSSFTRDIFLGGNSISEELQKKFGISFEEAETFKIARGIEGIGYEEGEDVITQGCRSIAAEIHKTLDFYSSTAYESVEKIYICGGCVKLQDVRSIVEDYTGIATEIMDCFRMIKCDEDMFDPEYIKDITPLAPVGVGLAMRRLGD